MRIPDRLEKVMLERLEAFCKGLRRRRLFRGLNQGTVTRDDPDYLQYRQEQQEEHGCKGRPFLAPSGPLAPRCRRAD